MQILHAADPAGHLTWFLVGLVDRVDINWSGARYILALHVLQLEHCLVLVVKTRLIEHRDTQIFLLTVRFGHLKEGIDFTDGGDVVRDEWLDLRLQVNFLGLVPLNVLKHLLELL